MRTSLTWTISCCLLHVWKENVWTWFFGHSFISVNGSGNKPVCMKCHPIMSKGKSVTSCYKWLHLKAGWKDGEMQRWLLKLFMVLHSAVDVKSEGSSCVRNEKEAKTESIFTPPHTWPITEWSGCGCWFRKITKSARSRLSNSNVRKQQREGVLDAVWWSNGHFVWSILKP